MTENSRTPKWRATLYQFLVYAGFLLLSVGLMFWYAAHRDAADRIQVAANEASARATTLKHTLTGLIEQQRNTVLVLSEDPHLQSYIARPGSATRANAARVLINSLHYSSGYDQIRYLDSAGKERIRVEISSGKIRVTPAKQLQDKSKRHYFESAMQLGRGKVYISPIDLNMEHGKVEIPLKPVMRVAAPVFDQAGTVRGIIVANYKISHLREHLGTDVLRSASNLYLLNANGRHLLEIASGERLTNWEYLLPHKNGSLPGLSIDQSLWRAILSSDTGFLESSKMLYSASHVSLPGVDETGNARSWVVLSVQSAAGMSTLDALFESRRLPLLIIATLISVAFSLFLSHSRVSLRRNLDELSRQNRLFHDQLEQSPDGILIVDTAHSNRMWNDRFQTMFGITDSVLLSSGWDISRDVMAHQLTNSAEFKTTTDRLLKHPEEDEYATELRMLDGRTIIRYSRGLMDGAGRYYGRLWIFTDITARKNHETKLLDGERRFRKLFEFLPDGVIMVDSRGNILMANSALASTFGYSVTELLSMNVDELVPISKRHKHRSLRQQSGRKHNGIMAPGNRTVRGQHRNGSIIPIEVRINSVTSDKQDSRYIASVHDLSHAEKMETMLQEAQSHLRLFAEHSADLMSLHDGNGMCVYISPASGSILSYEPEELVGKSLVELVHPDDRRRGLSELATRQSDHHAFSHRFRHKDGYYIWLESVCNIVRDNQTGEIKEIVCMSRDITGRLEAEQSMRKLSSAVEYSADMIMICDAEGRTEYINPAYTGITGYTLAEVAGKVAPSLTADGLQDQAIYEELWNTVQQNRSFSDILESRKKNGRNFFEERTVSPLVDGQGKLTHLIITSRDISQRMENENRLQHLAYHDALTGLPNRAHFLENLEYALALSARHKENAALLFIDLDRFKTINDTLGHESGDRVLKAVAKRLTGLLRKSDTISRMGGDEFVALLPGIHAQKQAARLAQKILDSFALPLNIDGRDFYITASIGIAIYPDDSLEGVELLKFADTAMYRAKTSARNSYMFFSREFNIHTKERMDLEMFLRKALNKNEFHLVYQPQASLRNGEIVGIEALLRWTHPEKGMIPPDQFIPILEETGMILEVGEWILHQACRDWCTLNRDTGLALRLGVNVSVIQFNDNNFSASLKNILHKTGVPAALLELEITESLLMQDADKARTQTRAFRDMGIRIAIDDFGTGYSSLSYLRHFAVDTLKIDRAFIRDLPDNSDDAAIAESILALGRALGLKVLAEGIETREQLDFLAQRQCDEIQGYYCSKPVTLEHLIERLNTDSGSRVLSVPDFTAGGATVTPFHGKRGHSGS